MKKIILFLIPAAIVIFLIIYWTFPMLFLPKNPIERNKIMFNSPCNEINDSISVFFSLVKKLDILRFSYREINSDISGDYHSAMLRFLDYFPDNVINYDKYYFKELDRKNNLILLANKNAKNWTN